MIRGFVIGLFVSAGITLAIFRAIDTRRASADSAPATAGAETRSGTDSAAELAKVASDNAALKKQIEEAKAAAVPGKGETAATSSKPKKKKTVSREDWKEISAKLVAFMKRQKEAPGRVREDGEQDVFLAMYALMGKLAKQYGVSLNEAMMTPDGFPALLMSALDQADPPLTDSEKEALEKVMASAREAWEELQKESGGKTALERNLELTKNGYRLAEEFSAAVLPEHAELVSQMQAIGMNMGGGMGGSYYTSGGHDEVRANFAKQWAKTLKFDESQASAFEPIVEEYLKACEASTAQASKVALSTDKGVALRMQQQMALDRLAAQIEAQKKIESSFTLSDEQKKAVENWTTTYVYWNNPTPVAPTDSTPEQPEEK